MSEVIRKGTTVKGSVQFGKDVLDVRSDLITTRTRINEMFRAICNTRRLAKPDIITVEHPLVLSLTRELKPDFDKLDDGLKLYELGITAVNVKDFLALQRQIAYRKSSQLAFFESIFIPLSGVKPYPYLKLPNPTDEYFRVISPDGMPEVKIHDTPVERMIYYTDVFQDMYPDEATEILKMVIPPTESDGVDESEGKPEAVEPFPG